MASMAKKVNNIGVMFQFCRNPIDCAHQSKTVHAFIHQTCIAPRWQKTNKSDIIWLYTIFLHLFKMFKSFLTKPMHDTSFKYGIPSGNFSRWNLVEHSPSILNSPTLCLHVNQAICHKDIWIISTVNNVLVNTPALFSYNHTGTCIQHPHKSNRAWAHTFLLHLSKQFKHLLPSPHFTCPNIMAFQVITFQNGILLNTLQASLMLPPFAYMSTKLLHTKTSESHPLWIICWWAHLPSLSATMLAHAFNSPTKVTELGCTPSCCICQNSSIASCPWLHFTCPNTMAVQVTISWDEIFLNTLQAFSMLPHFAYMPMKLLPTETSDSQPLWMSCLWTIPLSSSVPKPANAITICI